MNDLPAERCSTMYFINRVQETMWSVCDDSAQEVFVGDWRAVEDWLDWQENLAQSRRQALQRRASVVSRLKQTLQALFMGERPRPRAGATHALSETVDN
ncbi:MAG: hypothetical protein JSS02_35545 [Planctomycetes bacterium]|nr:hypothetical protein [Planctomycetota bacterium]